MKPLLFSLFLFLTYTFSQAQPVQISPSSLDFGIVDENDRDSLSFTLVNQMGRPLRIKKFHAPAFYAHQPFSLSQNAAVLPVSGNQSFFVRLHARHNLLHHAPIIVETDSFFGCFPLVVDAEVRYSQSYYNSTYNLEGQSLFNALRTRVSSPYTDLGYNGARDEMYGNIDNVNGQVECVYTGRTATFSTRTGANSNNFNTEHTFPQGFFNSASPMKSDIHHLFPTDVNANSQRGNLPFGVVTGSPSWQQGGSKMGNGVFEPRDVHKGTVARAMLYFVLRHQDYSNFLAPQENLLRSWNASFPPVAKDINRNNAIAQLQQNRNPFTDYPAFLDRLGSFAQNGAMSTQEWKMYPDTLYMKYGQDAHIVLYGKGSQSASLSVADPALQWSSSAGSGPFAAGIVEGDLQLTQNSSGATLVELKVGNTTVDDLWIVYQSSGLSVEESAAAQIQIAPNPAGEIVWINLFGKEGEVVLMDLQGRQLMQQWVGGESRWDVSHLARGLYQIRWRLEGGQWNSERLILR